MIERNLSSNVEARLAEVDERLASASASNEAALADGAEVIERWERARDEKGWWRKLLRVPSAEERLAQRDATDALEHLARTEAATAEVGQDRNRWASGLAGERVIPDRYRPHLPDEWLLFNGCLSNGIDIDHLLLGPTGLWAIEVKNDKVLLRVDGEVWSGRFLDNHGNVVDERPAATKRGEGTSWGREIRLPAEALARQLERRDTPTVVNTAVVLVNELARVEHRATTEVDLVTADLDELDRAIFDRPAVLDAERIQRLDDLIVAHHDYHQRRRARTRRPSAPGDRSD